MALTLHGNNGLGTTNGTAAAPSLAAPDSDTGFYFGTNLIHATTGGTERLRITGDGPHLLLGGTSDVNEITESSANAGMVIGGTGFGNAGLAIITSTTGAGRLYFGDNIASDAGRNRGAIIYYHSSDHMHFQTAGSERLRITSAGLVGINRTSPNHTLEVGGNVYITSNTTTANEGGGLLFQAKGGGFNSTSCAAIKGLRTSDTSSYLVFETGGTTERLRITSDGVLKLTGQTTVRETAGLTHHTNNNLYIRGGTTGLIMQSVDENEAIVIQNTYITAVTNGSERLRITSGGYLGVNQTSPSTRLDVKQDNGVAYNGNAQSIAYNAARFHNTSGHTSGGTYTGFQFNISGDSQNRICSMGMITEASNSRASSLVFHTDDGGNRTEKLRITSAGKLGLGVASPASESGWGNILHINSASAGAHIRFTDNTSGSGAGDGSYIGHYGNDTYLVNKESSGVIIFNTNGSERLRIDSNGILTTKQSSTNATSTNWNGAIFSIQNTHDTDNNSSVVYFMNSATGVDCAIQGIHEDAAGTGAARRGHIQFGTSGANSSGSCVERLRINSSGQLITGGTATPYPTRSVTIQPVTGQTNTYLSIVAGSTSGVSGITFGDTAGQAAGNYAGMFEYYHSDDSLRYAQNASEKLRITSGGDMGLGTTSPDRKLDVSGTGNVYGKFQSTNATGAGIEVKDTAERWLIQADGGVGPGLAFYDLGRTSYRFVMGSAGQLGIGGANYGSSGQVLTSQGASAAPQWASAGGGWTTGTENTNVNSTSSVSQTGLSNPDKIEIVCHRLRNSGANGVHYVQIGTSGGYTGTYNDIARYNSTAGSNVTTRGHDQSQWVAWHYDFDGTSNEASGTITITKVIAGTYLIESSCIMDSASNNTQYHIHNAGRVTFSGTLDRVKIYTSSGTNFTNGMCVFRSM